MLFSPVLPLQGQPSLSSAGVLQSTQSIPVPPLPYFAAPVSTESDFDKVCAYCSAHFIRNGHTPSYTDVTLHSPLLDSMGFTGTLSAVSSEPARSWSTAVSSDNALTDVRSSLQPLDSEEPMVPQSPNAALRMMAEISCLPRVGLPGVQPDVDTDLTIAPPVCIYCSSYITPEELKLLDETVRTLEGWRKTTKPQKRHRGSWDGGRTSSRRDSAHSSGHTPKRAATSATMHHSHEWSEVSGDSLAVKPSNDYGAQRFLRDNADRHGLDAKVLLDDVYTAAQHSHSKFKPNVDMDSYGTTGKYVLRKWAMAMIRATIEAVAVNKRVKKYTLSVPSAIADKLPAVVKEVGFKNKGAAAEYLVHDVLGLGADFVPKVAENALTVERAYAILSKLYELNPTRFCVPVRRDQEEYSSDSGGHDDIV